MQQALKPERLNVNFITEEEQALLTQIKSQAVLKRLRLRDHILDIFRAQLEREGAIPDKGKKK